MEYNSNPALRHLSPALATTAAAALAERQADKNRFYKAIYFNKAGVLDVIDSYGHVEPITGAIGTVYPCQICGVQTGGTTTLIEGEFVVLYDWN